MMVYVIRRVTIIDIEYEIYSVKFASKGVTRYSFIDGQLIFNIYFTERKDFAFIFRYYDVNNYYQIRIYPEREISVELIVVVNGKTINLDSNLYNLS
jgi:hypothetical protein